MSNNNFGKYGGTHPWLGAISHKLGLPLSKAAFAAKQFYCPDSLYARERVEILRGKLRKGSPIYLLGFGPGGHNSGIALVEITQEKGIRLLCNNEEERYTGIKHYAKYPSLSIDALIIKMKSMGLKPEDIDACLASWNYAILPAAGLKGFMEEFPHAMDLLKPENSPDINFELVMDVLKSPKMLGDQLGMPKPMPVIGMRHHDNHAYFSYAVSPFARSEKPAMIIVADGYGDDGSVSFYIAQGQDIKQIYCNNSFFDSIGVFYTILSATQGGWTPLSSEGRYMGAAAWGNDDRLTNPYYRRLRQLFYFAEDGRFYLNQALANWHRRLLVEPYTEALIQILGDPIPQSKMWNPDAVLNVENVKHAEITQERVDKAAAVQLLFEDLVFHMVQHVIQKTGSNQLVFTGGIALNCIANMRLLDKFNEAFYERYLGLKDTRLHIWVPPTPGDAGAAMGAAYSFALTNGAPLGESLQHAFYCGLAPETSEICEALNTESEIAFMPMESITDSSRRNQLADLIAYIISQDGVVGIYQGVAETGPRALGHRTILANPCNPKTRENLNLRVKNRELIRPLAPMATLETAQRLFELSPGASDDDYNAYRYMVLTAIARPGSNQVVPSIIHKDGTARVQIVSESTNPFVYAFLKAMGRRVGVELSVNTSLNVGGPIVQTPRQALQTLKRAKGMDGLFMIGADGQTFFAWHNVSIPPKDAGERLKGWIQKWQDEHV